LQSARSAWRRAHHGNSRLGWLEHSREAGILVRNACRTAATAAHRVYRRKSRGSSGTFIAPHLRPAAPTTVRRVSENTITQITMEHSSLGRTGTTSKRCATSQRRDDAPHRRKSHRCLSAATCMGRGGLATVSCQDFREWVCCFGCVAGLRRYAARPRRDRESHRRRSNRRAASVLGRISRPARNSAAPLR